jgi:hypothetical protein
MKKIITICAAILMTASVFAQSPEKMSYQAVVRDGNNNLVSSTAVGMQISILQGSASGTAVYVETQTPTSNANGLVSLEIGAGTVVSGDFTTIDWENGPFFIQTETDPTGGANYTITGTSQLLSVPYALYAKTSGSSTPGPAGSDGNGIASTTDNGDGTFTFTYDDGSTFTTSDLTGPQGNTGPTGAQGPAGANGTNGLDGNGIASTTDNGDGTFTFTYDDGSTFTTSDLTGPQGAQGIQGPQGAQGPAGANGTNGLDGNGIASTSDNGDGTFTFTYDDGSTFTTSDLTGPQGIQGPQGVQGPAGANGTNGLDGNGIASTTDNGDGTFTFTYDDGSTFNTSDLTGPQGPAGSVNNEFYLGQDTLGGIVFYIYLDQNGDQRGLIVNKNEITTQWQSSGTFSNATRSWDGVYNTGLMTGSPAATYVNGLTDGGFTDWYLPSIDELSILWHNRFHANNALNAGGFTLLSNTAYYWSSTELYNTGAFRFGFTNGNASYSNKTTTESVRAVRAF